MIRLLQLMSASLAVLLAAVLTAGCGMSEEEKARQKLADLNIEYTEQAFAEHAGEGDQNVVDLFIKSGMDPVGKAESQLSVAGIIGNWDGFQGLQREVTMKVGATLDWDESTPLMMAAVQGQGEVVRRLLEAGADPEAQATLVSHGDIIRISGITPLHWSAFSGNKEIADLLLEAGADPSTPLRLSFTRHEWDGTPPMVAASRANTGVLKALLGAGADLHAVNERDEFTALMSAVKPGTMNGYYTAERIETIRVLLEAGADPQREDKWNHSSLNFLRGHERKSGVRKVKRLMREASTRG